MPHLDIVSYNVQLSWFFSCLILSIWFVKQVWIVKTVSRKVVRNYLKNSLATTKLLLINYINVILKNTWNSINNVNIHYNKISVNLLKGFKYRNLENYMKNYHTSGYDKFRRAPVKHKVSAEDIVKGMRMF